MVKSWNKVPLKISMHIRVLHQDYGWLVADIKKLKFPQIPTRTIQYHAKLDTNNEVPDGRKKNKGRPRKLDARDVRRIGTTIKSLREFDSVNFTAVKLSSLCGFTDKCCTQTVRRRLNDLGIYHLNTRQKGIMFKRDIEHRYIYIYIYIYSFILYLYSNSFT